MHLATLVSAHCTRPTTGVTGETRISLPAKPSLNQTTLGQLCSAGYDRAQARTQSLWWHSSHCSSHYSALNHCATREAPEFSLLTLSTFPFTVAIVIKSMQY